MLLSQSEVGEVGFGGGGGSSTMPQKQNPVLAETLVTLARHTAGLLGTAHGALIHGNERDGAAWASEWLVLPQMAVSAGAALAHAMTILDTLTIHSARMMTNLEASNGAVLAESASFALSEHMPRADAYSLVKMAARKEHGNRRTSDRSVEIRERCSGRLGRLLPIRRNGSDHPGRWWTGFVPGPKRPERRIEPSRS